MCPFSFFSKPSSPSCRRNIMRAVPRNLPSATFDALDAEIRSVFKPSEMITPDQVRGKHATLEEAVLHNEWPTLAAARGKVVFLMDQRAGGAGVSARTSGTARPHHLYQCASLASRIAPSRKRTTARRRRSPRWCARGTWCARARTPTRSRREPTIRPPRHRSGERRANIEHGLSRSPSPRNGRSYSVGLPGGAVARCNPVNGPPSCSNQSFTTHRNGRITRLEAARSLTSS